MIIGIDEVGRGAWAGPVAVGAVRLGDSKIAGLTDSKKLTAKKRLLLSHQIKLHANSANVGWVSAQQLDKIGMTAALKLAIMRALKLVDIAPDDQIIIDGTQNFLKDTPYAPQVTTLKQADLLVQAVSAASILAKVARDNYMVAVDKVFPDYGFATHVGYGTQKHNSALQVYGPSPVHRMSFAPMSTAPVVTSNNPLQQTSGYKAEEKAADYLLMNGFKILQRNWKTKWCEIDIVAEKNRELYFVEVKYRLQTSHGDGISYVTPKKLQQMRFAAEFWLHLHQQEKLDAQAFSLSAIGLSGNQVSVDEFIERL